MIGELRWSLTPFYDLTAQRNSFKRRPVLFIAKADSNDYVALPLSRITRRDNLDPVYDIEVDPAVYPNLNLSAVSYIRTHKQTIINRGEVAGLIGNMKAEYPDLYLTILEKREQFSKEISNQAI